jgi:hypothetical protein
MSDYLPDVKTYAPNANEAHVAAIVKYCGIALRNADSALVSASDPKELATVRNGFAAKMKGEGRKSRVTFYYLLAEATGTLDKLG